MEFLSDRLLICPVLSNWEIKIGRPGCCRFRLSRFFVLQSLAVSTRGLAELFTPHAVQPWDRAERRVARGSSWRCRRLLQRRRRLRPALPDRSVSCQTRAIALPAPRRLREQGRRPGRLRKWQRLLS